MESPKKGCDLGTKTLAFKKSIAIVFCDLKTSLGARACVQVLCIQKTRRFAFAFLSPLSQEDSRDQSRIFRHSLSLSLLALAPRPL